MLDFTTLTSFAVATLVLLLVPGPAVVYVVTRTMQLGLRRGLLGTLGVECGTLVHVAAAAVGLSAMLARSEVAYLTLKYAGAAYLLYLGLRQLVGSSKESQQGPGAGLTPSAFRQGFVVEALNPKTALFFIAFLPQFVDPAAGRVAVQIAALGLVFVLLALVIDVTYALVAARVSSRISARAHNRHLDRASGVVHIALAALAATARRAA